MSQKLDLSHLIAHIDRSFISINLLLENQQYCHSRYLAFILIDQMAWLISGSEKKVNVYFKYWLNKYFIKYYPEINAEEIWASRNGYLHSHSSISRDIENNKVSRQLIFIDNVYNAKNIISSDCGEKLDKLYPVNANCFLKVALVNSVKDFMDDLKSDNFFDLKDIKLKLGKILQPVCADI